MTSNQLFSQQTGHKYTFQLQLKKLYINPSLPFEVKIVWARGQNRIQSQNPIKLVPPQNQITLQQCFCNKSTVLFSPKRLQFRKKQSRIQIILYANGSPKQGGEFVVNLCEILDPYNIKKQQQKTYRVVTRQQKPRCQIQFKLTAEYCQQMLRDEQRSIGSGVGSISSKNTTSMGHGPNGLQSISNGLQSIQSKQYVQKKNLFLYQAPSKDNQSVVSYNSYSTNMMRYQSGAKKQRQDSTRKEDYGIATTTRRDTNNNDMFSKTTSVNMKSMQFQTRSKGGYNRVTQAPNNQYDNRTQNFDNASNKQLQDEQSKRSKLQAQVSKLNIYMKEQSSKLTEYIQQNTKLKQQLNRMSSSEQSKSSVEKETQLIKQHYEDELRKCKQENDDMHNRAFELNNQNRELHRRLDSLLEEREKIDEEVRRVKLEKQRAEVRFESLNRNMEGIITTKEMSSKEVDNLKDQLEHIKSLNANLRDSLDKERRKTEQLQYSTNYQQSSLQQNFKKKEQHLYELERQNTQLMTQVRDRQRELQTKKELIYRLEKTSSEYKEKILLSESEKSKFLLQNATLKNESQRMKLQLSQFRDNVTKVRDDKTAEYEQRNTQLETTNYQSQQRIRSLQSQLQQSKKSYTQLMGLNDTIKMQLQNKKTQNYRLQANLRPLREIETKFYSLDKVQSQKERQLSSTRQQNTRLANITRELQDQCKRLTNEVQSAKDKSLSMPNVDVNEILRESVQMQVELKFKTDELLRLKGIEEKFNQLVYRLQMEERNRKQIEEETQRLEKEVKDKNKLYLIEVEKGKLVIREKTDIQRAFQQLKQELKRCQEIIFNGDRQVKDMEQHINSMQNQNVQINKKLSLADSELTTLKSKGADTQKLQSKIKQLQHQCNQKLSTLNLLTNNMANAQKRIHQLQYLTKTRQTEIQQAVRTAQSASHKLIEMEDTKSTISNQLHKLLTEKKSLELKCETIMQQLHSLKKQYEEEKVRSTSVVSIRSSEDQVKIRQIQNELDKKDKLISKLTKEKLQLEEENINLHVQVMKKLSQMEKNKDSTHSTDGGITSK